ncbi:MAG TPA: hypothetical protein VHN12_12965 [Geobacteraceae bacterium]|nr:hypothetical protein [Geobacteraceae bacterium]
MVDYTKPVFAPLSALHHLAGNSDDGGGSFNLFADGHLLARGNEFSYIRSR